ncbi:MAG: elongator complex protein 3 [Minisyncoccales bacterium]
MIKEEQIVIDLIKWLKKRAADLNLFKRQMAKKYKIACPSNVVLLKAYHNLLKKKKIKNQPFIESLLRTRPIRSLSGIVNISVLTKPYPCPGQCLYCPLENNIPKSYVSGEPAVDRAKNLNYDPYRQTQKRIEALKLEGHPTDKIELRIVGGTWSFYPKKYQVWFIKRCFDACNEKTSRNLKQAQKLNEKAKHKIVGLSVETRPDFINQKEIKWLRGLGVTMVELGVQSIDDDVLKLNLRGHGTKEIISATKLLKDAGFKVLYQMMLNLPDSDLAKDEQMFEELFKNPNFQPDYLKIYPCALLKEAPLFKLWQAGKYQPYTEKQLIELLIKIKKKIPYYVRIQRIVRDIPSQKIISGVKISNLRQVLIEKMKKENWRCQCIRCREIKKEYDPKEKIYLFRQDYQANDGQEIFLSFENKNRTKLYSLLRLRIPLKSEVLSVFPILKNASLVREIHTYGETVPIGKKKIAPQHQGLGKKLMKVAEKISKKEFGLREIAIIAAIGARNYFRKLGYQLNNTYLIKKL